MDVLFGNTLVNKLALGALSGFGGALLIDYAEFRKWKSVQEFISYNWGVAAFRWVQGAVGGVVAAAGLAAGDAAM